MGCKTEKAINQKIIVLKIRVYSIKIKKDSLTIKFYNYEKDTTDCC